MTLTDNDRIAELSYAYLHAVASSAGFTCSYSNRTEDGYRVVDARIGAGKKPDPASILEDFEIEVQLKATKQKLSVDAETGRISYPFNGVNQYKKLSSENNGGQKFLVLLKCPENLEIGDLLQISDQELLLKCTAYWVSLRGAPHTENAISQTIYIPRKNILTVINLTALMVRISKREVIKYEL